MSASTEQESLERQQGWETEKKRIEHVKFWSRFLAVVVAVFVASCIAHFRSGAF